MRDFLVLFVLGGLFAVGWSHFLWGVLSRFIKLLMKGMVGTAFRWKTGRKKASWKLLSLGLLAGWTQTLILIGALQLSSYVVTVSESRRNMEMFKIYQSWGCDCLLLCIWPSVYLWAPFPPFSPAVSWGFGPQNQANHIIIVQMAIICVWFW